MERSLHHGIAARERAHQRIRRLDVGGFQVAHADDDPAIRPGRMVPAARERAERPRQREVVARLARFSLQVADGVARERLGARARAQHRPFGLMDRCDGFEDAAIAHERHAEAAGNGHALGLAKAQTDRRLVRVIAARLVDHAVDDDGPAPRGPGFRRCRRRKRASEGRQGEDPRDHSHVTHLGGRRWDRRAWPCGPAPNRRRPPRPGATAARRRASADPWRLRRGAGSRAR